MSDYPETLCRRCGNTGKINVGNPGQTVWETCPSCHGKSWDPERIKREAAERADRVG